MLEIDAAWPTSQAKAVAPVVAIGLRLRQWVSILRRQCFRFMAWHL